MAELETVSPPQYIWAMADDPTLFLQYQVNSCAKLRFEDWYLVVWQPKYIEYPVMIQFPELKDKKCRYI